MATIFNPFKTQNYLGAKKKNYFEGWYFRVAGEHPFSLIAGVSKNAHTPHSFIMFISPGLSHYFKFKTENFYFAKHNMAINIAGNSLSLNRININLNEPDISVKADITLKNQTFFKKSFYCPSVMGPFGYFKMPCNHAVILLKGNAAGNIAINQKQMQTDALCYIEKDFGKNFPANYIWAHGIDKDFSIMFAYACPILQFRTKGPSPPCHCEPHPKAGLTKQSNHTPRHLRCHPSILEGNLGGKAKGLGAAHLCIVLYKNKQYNFSVYTLTKLNIQAAGQKQFAAKLKRGRNMLEFNITNKSPGSPLTAPAEGGRMETKITESLAARMVGTLKIHGKTINFDLPSAYEFVNKA